MNRSYLISGGSPGPNSYAVGPTRSNPARLISVIGAFWLLAGAGFFAWKLGFPKPAEFPAPGTAKQLPATVMGMADLAHHIEAVNTKITESETRMRRSEDLVSRLVPALERNDLFVERRHLENALAVSRAARRDLELARQDVDLVLNSIKEIENK